MARWGQLAPAFALFNHYLNRGYKMSTLRTNTTAATLLLRNSIGKGYMSGPEFPGDTIRKGINKLYKIGFLADSEDGRMVITRAGKDYLLSNHLQIKA